MDNSFSQNLVLPNLPLRRPSTTPTALSPTSPFPSGRLATSVPTALLPTPGSPKESQLVLPVSKDKTAVPCLSSQIIGSTPPVLHVYFCNYCGHQGNFRCKRCKKTSYCSVVCQTEDWKAHRHICKSFDREPENKNKASSVTADTITPLKHGDVSSSQRVYLKDLHLTKISKGIDIQASVVEFQTPARFFLFLKSPELLEALQNISTELQKTCSQPTVVPYVPSVGEICAVQFSFDMKWYRGLVQTLASDQKMARILYIDFGNEEEVQIERIRPLDANIQLLCPCAMECRIAGIVPVSGNWSSECCIAVRQMLVGKTVSFRLVETLENRVHAVDILLSMGKQLSTFLIEHSYAAREPVSVTLTEQDISATVSASWDNFRRFSSGTDDNTWAQSPEPLTLTVGGSYSVVVTHFQSPSEMFVQKVENARVIQELQVKLREHCTQVTPLQNFRPAPDTVCCAQFSEDKQWYRAKVLAYSSEKGVCVGYLDFGNSEVVDLGNLQPISTSLLELPMQAMRCGLAGVQPLCDTWSEECLMALQCRLSNRILSIVIQGTHEGKAIVTMIDEASDPQANIAELLITAGYGALAPVETDQTTAGTEPYVPKPTVGPLVWSCVNPACDGQTVVLLPCVVKNPGEFYCHLDNPADHQQLNELGNKIKQHCEMDATPFKPILGEPCCAMFPGDGAWYRAIVKELCEDQVFVNFVDYGYTMKVEKGHLRAITPQLLTLPFQAIRCFLAGVMPLGSEWSSEALLWFRSLVDGKQLSARVLSVTAEGCGVELESGGQNVAVALISEHLARSFGQTYATKDTEEKCQESAKKNEESQIHLQAFNQTGTISKEMPAEGLGGTSSEVPTFPVDWKTVELPLNSTFQPCFTAITSPSLFYLMGAKQADKQKLQEVMKEVAAYCTNNEASLSSSLTQPPPGAACCAKFSADNQWYRAVVLEAGKEISVIYADFGNTEKVPASQILPIPLHLLQLPFQIIRCTLAGKEHFPPEWPEKVQQMFRTVVLNGVLATAHSFDGSAYELSLTVPTERGGGNLTAMIMEELQAQTKINACPVVPQRNDQTDRCIPLPSPSPITPPDSPKPMPEIQKEFNNTIANSDLTMTTEQAHQPLWQNTDGSTASISDDPMKMCEQASQNTGNPETSSCCCQSLKIQMERLEQLMHLQLSLIKQLMGQTN